MPDTWITNLTHFLEAGRLHPELPGPARKLADHLGAIIVAVTSVDPDDPLGVPCRRRPNRRPCGGEIEAFIDPETHRIHWACLACGDNGVISNWEHTMWDCRDACEQTRH